MGHNFVASPPLAINKQQSKLMPTQDQPSWALNNWAQETKTLYVKLIMERGSPSIQAIATVTISHTAAFNPLKL